MNKLLLIFFLMFTTSCSSLLDNYSSKRRDLVKLTTSSAGAYLGYQFSDADIFSTLIASAGGILLGNYINEYLDKNDYYYYHKALLETLNENQLGKSGYWKNNKTGNEGVVVVKNYYRSPECRIIEHKYIKKNVPKSFFDTACRENSGSWRVIR
tara:strand:+ start:119 stop:580 length:462 start_codon:yes stop_codon:yes gene_type:complete